MVAGGSDIWVRLNQRARAESPDMVDGPVAYQEPLTDADLDAVAEGLATELPPAVRRLWGQVANGGFGPGYGILGLQGGFRSDLGDDAVSDYRARRLPPGPDEPSWKWPKGLLPICDWGCAIYSCVDLGSDTADVYRFDPNAVADDWNVAWFTESRDLESWLRGWLDGEDLWMSPGIVPASDDFLDARS